MDAGRPGPALAAEPDPLLAAVAQAEQAGTLPPDHAVVYRDISPAPGRRATGRPAPGRVARWPPSYASPSAWRGAAS